MSADDRERDEAPPFEGAGDALPSSDELELFAYLDGELDDDAAARFEERLEGDRELAAKLTAMSAISGFVRDDAARIYGAARVDTIVDDVLAKLAPQAAAPLRLAPVVEIAAPQSTRFSRNRSTSIVWIGGALAVAAAVALFVGTRRDPIAAPPVAATSAKTSAPSETVAVNVVPTASRAVDPPPPAAGTPGVEVEDLEVGEGATVIYTGSAQGAVVWVNDKR
jgi:anti-sigma factor RsiW